MKGSVVAMLAAILASPTSAVEKGPDARAIIRRVLDRDNGSSEVARIRISSCRYARTGRALACTETPRKKLLLQFTKEI